MSCASSHRRTICVSSAAASDAALLFLLPGAPLLVYGDEIGMGEDLSQPGRAAVRALMQWSAEANAGFSSAPPESLVQRVISEGPFSYRNVNAATQTDDPDSLLSRVRRLIYMRRAHPEIGNSPYSVLDTDEPGVFVHGYDAGTDKLITLHNLSGAEKSASVGLDSDSPAFLIDLFTGTEQRLADGRERIMLGLYEYRWYRVSFASP